MIIIGCDLHTRYQQIAMLDTDTGELVERRLEHEGGEARAFYAALSGEVRVGIEATGQQAGNRHSQKHQRVSPVPPSAVDADGSLRGCGQRTSGKPRFVER